MIARLYGRTVFSFLRKIYPSNNQKKVGVGGIDFRQSKLWSKENYQG